MVNFLRAPRNRKLNSVISNASNDSGASLDASPVKKVSRPNATPRKQLTSPRGVNEKTIATRNTPTSKRVTKDNSRITPSSTRRNSSHVQFDSRNPSQQHETIKTTFRPDARNDCPRDGPPVSSPIARPLLEQRNQFDVDIQPLSPKSQNSVNTPKGILKTSKKEVPSASTPASSSMQRENESWFSRSRRGIDDETLSSLTSDQTSKTKMKKKGLFSRFGRRREPSDRSNTETVSSSNEIVHEIIVNDSRQVSVNPIVVTVGGSGDEATKEGKSPKKANRNPDAAKTPQHDKEQTGFADSLASFFRVPASSVSPSVKKRQGEFVLEVLDSEPVPVVSPRSTPKLNKSTAPTPKQNKSTAPTPKQNKSTASTPKQNKSTATPPKQNNPTPDLPETLPPENPRQQLTPLDPARQEEWIVSVIEAIHKARRMPNDEDYYSLIDSEDSDILAGPRVVYMTSGELDDASVSSIEMLFHWMTCTMDRAYPVRQDLQGMQVAGDDFSLIEDDESSDESIEY